MFKKIEIWVLYLFLILFLIIVIFYGALLKHHYSGGERFPEIQKIAVFLSEIPSNVKNVRISFDKKDGIIFYDNRDVPPPRDTKNKDKERFKRYIKNSREELLVLSRYDGDLKKSLVEIVDLNTFKVLHTYRHDIDAMNNQITNPSLDVINLRQNISKIRFEYSHPIILEDGSLISNSGLSPLFKIDFCSNLVWMNQEYNFHHSKELDNNNSIWTAAQIFPFSKTVSRLTNKKKFIDDVIVNVSKDGEIKFIKSVFEILVENDVVINNQNLSLIDDWENDPIHLNDVQPALKKTKYWNEGDLFLSPRNLHAIVQYRPSTNKVIRFIRGPFNNQHDVDIISDYEISIFNNNNKVTETNENNMENLGDDNFSEVTIYNFETKTFTTKFNNELKNINFKSHTAGLSDIFEDGSLYLEEENYGRIVLLDKNGKLEWEFVNKDNQGNINMLSWSRIIKDRKIINNIRNLIETKKCPKN